MKRRVRARVARVAMAPSVSWDHWAGSFAVSGEAVARMAAQRRLKSRTLATVRQGRTVAGFTSMWTPETLLVAGWVDRDCGAERLDLALKHA
jgi:hypothetical protein